MLKEKDLKNSLLGVKRNISLKDYSTFKIGGIAKYFFKAETKGDIIKAITTAKENHLPFFILGGGSNILFSDKPFNGLIIKINNQGIQLKKNIILAGAGITLSKLLSELIKKNLSGLEWAIGIPGTLGGAIYGNAGAFSKSMQDIIKNVEVLDIRDLKIKKISLKQCKFGYKESIFKKSKNLIIISAELNYKKGDAIKMKKEMIEMSKKRKNSQPINSPSVGCIFKNYLGVIKDKRIIEKFPELKIFNQKKIIPVGFLIEKCGLKEKIIGDAKISDVHANFIINLDKARARDVLQLINLIKKSVKNKFGINLEEEIQIFC
jgi:UDP-N-acetylmuramate dehydrogenase